MRFSAAIAFCAVMPETDARRGGMAEWLNALVLKTSERASVPGVRIPVPPPGFIFPLSPVEPVAVPSGARAPVLREGTPTKPAQGDPDFV